MSLHAHAKTRLESWTEVAAYFRRAERTVKRWEAARGLPVRRLPGSPKSRIYAEVAELEAWRLGAEAERAREEAGGAHSDRLKAEAGRWSGARRWAPWLAGLAAVCVAAVALIANGPPGAGAGPRAPSANGAKPRLARRPEALSVRR